MKKIKSFLKAACVVAGAVVVAVAPWATGIVSGVAVYSAMHAAPPVVAAICAVIVGLWVLSMVARMEQAMILRPLARYLEARIA